MKRCSRCKKPEGEVEFFSKASGYCKGCAREYQRERYVPVSQCAEQRRVWDRVWGAKHDAKVCSVCERHGSREVTFRSLRLTRCSDCMTRGLWSCKTHGVSRNQRCQKCRYARSKVRETAKKKESKRQLGKQIFLMKGDGTCARCHQRIRTLGQMDRRHHCE